MAEFTIQTLCPTCGIVQVLGRNSRLNIYSDGSNRLTFICPNCQLRVIHGITNDVYLQLYTRVPRVHTDPPLEIGEVVRMSRIPLTEVEARDFVDDLTIYSSDKIIEEANG